MLHIYKPVLGIEFVRHKDPTLVVIGTLGDTIISNAFNPVLLFIFTVFTSN